MRETARDCGFKVIAEGIERKEAAEYCEEIGVDLVQGYLFGKPDSLPMKGPLFICNK
ncbi:EAL domain-containing protein [Fictibacillus sp. KIGAM418]|uniref:EAL domain-containing protein n=1 Tax=Fictibacillus marinisediminis TaxID=2878389 RepID=A0A9X1XB67_9BACL|nr:EAL domain-containing protein [Fictibacillus marinisediminis]MCK6256610.1 EAL domain-containing protein [Fictibacillus marinisediminis]